jgi:RHS repeat-associated protein
VTCAYFGAVENANAPCETSYSYHTNGNLWEKSDVGTYSYSDSKHPHAVTHVPGETFGYNAVGNQITRPGGISVTYTSFDLPKTITKGGKTTSIGYDGDQQRIRKTSPNGETVYFGDIFEQVTSAVGVIERRFYVHSPERAIAVVTRGGAEPGTRFFHTDHLGSIDVITKEDGSIAERRSYDAYGGRRNPEWGGPSGAMTSKTTRGFTGHEEDDEFGLVNMKGRMMDPRLGRFTTTDPVIADIWDGQTLNRYSYVNGNPLAFVDPTGFSPNDATSKNEPHMVVPEVHIVGKRPDWAEKTSTDDSFPRDEATKTRAYEPPVDVSTTGHGGEALPQETTPPEPKKVGFLNGVGAGLGDLVDDFWSFIPLTPSWSRNTVDMIDQMATAYQQGDIIDAFNVVNPLIPVANIALAVDNDDWYTVGQAAVGVGVAILSVVIAKKVPKIGKGAKTTRGPPRRKGPDYNWGDAKPHGGTVHNAAIDNDVARLRQDPAVSNIRKNQQQVDSNGNKVGTNRPDLQYDKNDCHTCVEYDHSARASAEHGRTIRRNDPNANVKLNKL